MASKQSRAGANIIISTVVDVRAGECSGYADTNIIISTVADMSRYEHRVI